MKFDDHPTVQALRARERSGEPQAVTRRVPLTVSAGGRTLSAEALRALCLEHGADDVGFVSIEAPTLAADRAGIERAFPGVRSLVCFMCRMQPENVRSPLRSISNQAFHATGHHVDETARTIVLAMQDMGVRACNPSMGFPMEAGSIPEERAWVVSHKIVAEAAGLGRMGLHRNVIHPVFGSFVLIGTVLIDRDIDRYSTPVDYNPCVDCRLCVAACPVGAISSDGHFDGSACMTHNYREFLGGFTDWVEIVADSRSALAYRARVEDPETLSMWQSLAFGPNYKSAYCLAVCPAGEDVLGPFIASKAHHMETIVRPLQQKNEPLYVVKGADAEAYAMKRFPHKRLRRVHTGIRPTSVGSFLRALPWLFQRGQAEGLAATYHFVFWGESSTRATIDIRDGRIDVRDGLHGSPDVRINADAKSWIGFLRGERNLAWLLLTRRIRLSPMPRGATLLSAFGRCFPS